MKFCIVGPAPPFRGGIAQHTSLLCKHLSAKNEVLGIAFRRLYPSLLFPGASQVEEGAESTHAEVMIDSMNPFSWAQAGRHISEFAPDCVLVQWWQPFFGPCLASILRTARPPCVLFVCHNLIPHESYPLSRRLTVHALQHAHGFLVHSNEQIDSLSTLVAQKPVRQIALSMFDAFPKKGITKDEARTALGVSGRTILFFGMIRRYKGLIDLIHAMGCLRDMSITCLVAGEFYDDKTKYLLEIQRLGLEDTFQIIDHYIPNEHVEQYFAAADAVVLPYTSATQSGIVQVAYGFNRPVIATMVGGLPEIVEHGQTGLLVPPGDPTELACAIRAFYDESMEPHLVDVIRRDSDRFSWHHITEEIESFAESILREK